VTREIEDPACRRRVAIQRAQRRGGGVAALPLGRRMNDEREAAVGRREIHRITGDQPYRTIAGKVRRASRKPCRVA